MDEHCGSQSAPATTSKNDIIITVQVNRVFPKVYKIGDVRNKGLHGKVQMNSAKKRNPSSWEKNPGSLDLCSKAVVTGLSRHLV